MDSPPTSSFEFFSTDGEYLAGPVEWMPGILALPVCVNEWSDAELQRNGKAMGLVIRRLGAAERVCADWPLSGTGHYELDLRVGGSQRCRAVMTITPRKISQDAYEQMLDDLEEELPCAIALSMQRLGAIIGIKFRPPGEATIAQELVRLRRAVDGFAGRSGLAQALTEISRDPHQVLWSFERWVRRDQARRVHPASLAGAVAAGYNIDSSGIPRRLPDLHADLTVDVYENRLVKAFVEQVEFRLRRVLRALERRGAAEALGEAQQISARMASARQAASFLSDVGRLSSSPSRITMVLVKKPPYRAAFEGFLEFHRAASVRFDDPALEAPLRGLPHLYETWGTLNVIAAVADVAAECSFEAKRHDVLGRDEDGFFVRVLPGGVPALVLYREADRARVRVVPQRSYSRQSQPLRSVSYEQIPDIAVEVDRPSVATQVYIFDPKYKLQSEEGLPAAVNARPKKVDIDTMHAYRDAIRCEDRRVVRYAATLYPGPTTQFAPGLEAISAIPGDGARLRDHVRSVLEPAFDTTS